MPLKSMTGFGRADAAGTAGPIDGGWHWEIRSVNGRGLEPRLRLPAGYESIETGVRDIIQRRLSRGSVSIALVIDRELANAGLTLNEEALTRVVAAARRARDLVGAAADAREVVDLRPLTLDQILSVRGVLESNDSSRAREPDGEQQKVLLAVLAIAVDRLIASRIEEGGRLGVILNQARYPHQRTHGGDRSAAAAPARGDPPTAGRAVGAAVPEPVATGRATAAPGGDAGGDKDRRRGGDRAPALARCCGQQAAGERRTGWPQARLPDPGVQPRGQHHLFESPPTSRRHGSGSNSRR